MSQLTLSIPPLDVYLIIPLVLLGQLHRWISRQGALLLVVSNLPITIAHELAHFLVALILGGRPTGISLWPQRSRNGWTLGSVTSHATILSATPTALAPLLWLPAGVGLLMNRAALSGGSVGALCGIYLAVYCCLAASVPSWQDIKVAATHPVSLLVWSGIAWGLWHLVMA